LSECLNSIRDVTCNAITNNFEADPESGDITLEENVKYIVRSLIGYLSVTLNIQVVNVLGSCNFTSLEVCVVDYI
jgi:hypothetical protein